MDHHELSRTGLEPMACKGSGVRIPVPPPSFSSVPQGSPHDCYENKITEHGHKNERRQRSLNNLTPIEFELCLRGNRDGISIKAAVTGGLSSPLVRVSPRGLPGK
jgi:hypothetical protein